MILELIILYWYPVQIKINMFQYNKTHRMIVEEINVLR